MQKILDLIEVQEPDFANFITGQNSEALVEVQKISSTVNKSDRVKNPGLEECIILWGDAGSGRSHLLCAAAHAAASAITIDVKIHGNINKALGINEEDNPGNHLLCIDDIDQLPASAYTDLFAILRRIEEGKVRALFSSACSPGNIKLPQEIKSRLSKFMNFRLYPLSDMEKLSAMQFHVQRRHSGISMDILQFFLKNVERDMRILIALIDAFDTWCLENKAKPSLVRARKMLKEHYPGCQA